ncbi:putative enzyme related to lactoylglutathione lyase [Tenacibaculum gallaicum]|uniref:Putative enzyme related to lactoylglutathione lyase n=1 Tax=Tenacibaculum gallaicum TaxID=561505 RepID=A0A3E0I1B6_9FLAO|nr:VOC family protein [Tenacibaculum gallaicum]REH52509.1 putative enzyme related to lactoylglutathione lyase [Tenacibaculum gallaicum]
MRRIVPNIYSNNIKESKEFYTDFLGMNLEMDMGWILTFVSRNNETAQISVFRNEENKPLNNSSVFLSIEVTDIDNWYVRAKKQNIEIVYPITNENWGVRRFFIKDPNGVTINLLSHL